MINNSELTSQCSQSGDKSELTRVENGSANLGSSKGWYLGNLHSVVTLRTRSTPGDKSEVTRVENAANLDSSKVWNLGNLHSVVTLRSRSTPGDESEAKRVKSDSCSSLGSDIQMHHDIPVCTKVTSDGKIHGRSSTQVLKHTQLSHQRSSRKTKGSLIRVLRKPLGPDFYKAEYSCAEIDSLKPKLDSLCRLTNFNMSMNDFCSTFTSSDCVQYDVVYWKDALHSKPNSQLSSEQKSKYPVKVTNPRRKRASKSDIAHFNKIMAEFDTCTHWSTRDSDMVRLYKGYIIYCNKVTRKPDGSLKSTKSSTYSKLRELYSLCDEHEWSRDLIFISLMGMNVGSHANRLIGLYLTLFGSVCDVNWKHQKDQLKARRTLIATFSESARKKNEPADIPPNSPPDADKSAAPDNSVAKGVFGTRNIRYQLEAHGYFCWFSTGTFIHMLNSVSREDDIPIGLVTYLTAGVISIFSHLRPVRYGSIQCMKVDVLNNSSIFVKDMPWFVIHLKDAKNQTDLFRAYPLWVVPVVKKYINDVRPINPSSRDLFLNAHGCPIDNYSEYVKEAYKGENKFVHCLTKRKGSETSYSLSAVEPDMQNYRIKNYSVEHSYSVAKKHYIEQTVPQAVQRLYFELQGEYAQFRMADRFPDWWVVLCFPVLLELTAHRDQSKSTLTN